MPDRFGLRKVVDGHLGERFVVVLIEGVGRVAESSKPLSASDTRKALHKMGTSDAAIDAMFDRARGEAEGGDKPRTNPTGGLSQT